MKKEDKKWRWNVNNVIIVDSCSKSAEGGSRTHKGVSPHDFESCASASSATSAYKKKYRLFKVESQIAFLRYG